MPASAYSAHRTHCCERVGALLLVSASRYHARQYKALLLERPDINTSTGQRDGFLILDGIESTYHISHRVCEATKHPNNPVLPLGDLHEWDATQARPWSSPTVIWDEEDRVFKAWYSGSDAAPEKWTAMGYATSQDGVTWEKPHLHLFDWRGSSANNIVALGYGPVLKDRQRRARPGQALQDVQARTSPAHR